MNTNLRPLSPFQDFCVKFLGYVPSSYDDCMTYLECLIYTYNYLKNEIVPTVNTQNTVIQEMKDYIDNYFDNLDVQQEINNKLDEMSTDGTLEEIITEYIQLKGVLAYNSVAEMKSATNLVDGSFVKTYGYYSANDGGGAFYKVREVTNQDVENDEDIIALSDENLVAELMCYGELKVEMFGVKGDNLTDDKAKIQDCINYTSNKKIKLIFDCKTYKISNYLQLKTDSYLIGNNTKIYCEPYTNSGNQPIFDMTNVNNIYVEGIEVYSENSQTDSRGQLTSNRNAFSFTNSHDIKIINCKGKYLHSFIWGSQLNSDYSYNIEFNGCETYETHEPLYCTHTHDMIINNMISAQCDSSTNYSHHVYINSDCQNITINNWEAGKSFSGNYGYLINIADSNSEDAIPENIIINGFNCKNATCSFLALSGTTATKLGSVHISNCHTTRTVDATLGGSNKRMVLYSGRAYKLTMNDCSFINYTNFCEAIEYNNLGTYLEFNNCYCSFVGVATIDFASVTSNMNFNNCTFNYNLTGNFRIISKGSSSPYINRIIFKGCTFNIKTTATWLIEIADKYSHVEFLNCVLRNDNITSGYFQANSGSDTANNVVFANNYLIGYDSDSHGGTSARSINKVKLDVTIT